MGDFKSRIDRGRAYLLMSANRESGDSTHQCSLTLPHREGLNGTYVVSHFQIPNTIYNVRSTNNVVAWTDSAGTWTASLPSGSYTGSTLATALKTLMDATSGLVYTVTYSSTTGKLTFSESIAGNINFDFATTTASTAHDVLGVGAVNTTPAATYTSTNVINLASPASVSLYCREAGDSPGFRSTSGHPSQIILPLLAEFGVYAFRSSDVLAQFMVFRNTTRTMYFELRDNNTGVPISFEGANWELYLTKVSDN